MKRIITVLTITLLAVTFFACKENDLEKQRENELKRLNEYMADNYTGEDPKPSGLYYFPLDEGTGDSIKIGDEVQIYYQIQRLDSTVIAETTGYSEGHRYDPIKLVVLPPTQLSSSATYVEELLALHEALTYMKKGSRSRLIFDSALGFGQYGTTGISGFSSLIMEVEVYKVTPIPVPEEEEEE